MGVQPASAALPGRSRAKGAVSSNNTPDGGNDKSPVPPNWRGMPLSISLVPKLRTPGAATGGPPLSTQRRVSDLPGLSSLQDTVTTPPSFDSALPRELAMEGAALLEAPEGTLLLLLTGAL